MDDKWRLYNDCVKWIFEVLSLPDQMSSQEFNEFISSVESSTLPIAKWIGFTEIIINHDGKSWGLTPKIPSMVYPPLIKPIIIPFNDKPSNYPNVTDYGFQTYEGTDHVKCLLTRKPFKYAWMRCIYVPDFRDVERIILNLEDNDYMELIRTLPLGDQLEQELFEARSCREMKLPIATIATFSIAIETACKIVLHQKGIKFNPIKDGLNDLLNHLANNSLITEKDRQAVLSLKGLRNSVDHSHSGTIGKHNSDLFYSAGEELLKRILHPVAKE